MKPSKKAQRKLKDRVKAYEETQVRNLKLTKPKKYHKPGSLNTRRG